MNLYLVKIYPLIKQEGRDIFIYQVISDCTENAITTACKKFYVTGRCKDDIKNIEIFNLGNKEVIK